MELIINKAAVLGAGVMGSGIAGLLAGAGLQVLLLDVVPGAMTASERAAGLTEESRAFRDRLACAGLDHLKNPKSGMLFDKSHLKNITVGNMTDDMHKLADCDWIIEVVVERLDVKRSVMRRVAKFRKPGAVVSTNTSGISVNEIVKDMPEEFSGHFLGTHFFNPPRFMRLFEMIPARDTLPQVVGRMAEFARRELGKTVVLAKDTPNFVGNRIGVYAAIDCMQQMERYGFSIPTVDLLSGPVMGRPKSATFRTADLVGLDVLCKVSRNVLDSTDSEAEQKRYAVPAFATALVEQGALGDKAGAGFYRRSSVDGKKITLAFDPASGTYLPLAAEQLPSVQAALRSANKYQAMAYGDGKENRFYWDTLKNTLLYAARLIPEITDDFRMVDKALTAGFNWEIGPFEIWDALGLERSVARMKAEGEEVPAWITEKLARGETGFYQEGGAASPFLRLAGQRVLRTNAGASIRDLGEEVLCLEFHTKGNAIADEIIDMIGQAVSMLHSGDWRGLVVGNEGKNFSAGANLALIGGYAQNERWDLLGDSISRLQQATLSLKYAPRPVVAAPFGTALGGGAEVTMHARCAVPHAETYLGLVEAGVGLLPAGGGCAEMLLRAADRCPDRTKLTMLPAVKQAWKLIATGAVTSSAFDAVSKGYLDRTTRIVMNRDALLESAKKAVLELDDWGYHPAAPATVKVLGDYGRAAIAYDLELMKNGAFISAHDALIAGKVAYVLTGGNLPAGTEVTEDYLLELEKEAFLSLAGEEKTRQRIAYMLANGKPLRN